MIPMRLVSASLFVCVVLLGMFVAMLNVERAQTRFDLAIYVGTVIDVEQDSIGADFGFVRTRITLADGTRLSFASLVYGLEKEHTYRFTWVREVEGYQLVDVEEIK